MTERTRFQLKHPTGWFAAGREVACALELLSDATFKLFVWLCLHAERSRGTVSATSPELARALGKKESDLHLALEELERQGVCTLRAEGVIEIRDRFWPYQRHCDPAARDESQPYVAEVKRLFLERRCVQSSFTAADEKLALSLFRRGVPLIHVERAILLGAVRKYAAVHENGHSTPISSLHYFTNLFEEVQQETSTHYWTYIAQGENIRANRALGFSNPSAIYFGKVKCDRRGTKSGMLWVDRVGNRRSEAILARNFSKKTGTGTKKKKTGKNERTGFTSGN